MRKKGAEENIQKEQENQCIGVSRGGRNTKIHAAVDALGNPITVLLTAGQVHDSRMAEQLLQHFDLSHTTVLADKAYGKFAFREFLADHGADFCIPPKSNEPDPWYCDWNEYKERHLVENFFLKIKEFRRVATRYDKLAKRFLTFVHIACIHVLLA